MPSLPGIALCLRRGRGSAVGYGAGRARGGLHSSRELRAGTVVGSFGLLVSEKSGDAGKVAGNIFNMYETDATTLNFV